MIEVLGERQRRLLELLLTAKAGMTVDELAGKLKITRNAVRQHLAALESDGLTAVGSTRPSGGRPQQLYVLTDKGKEAFPRRYAWIGQLVIEAIRREHGAEGLRSRMSNMGAAVGTQLRGQSPDLASREQKVAKLAGIMDGLGYSARRPAGGTPAIEADNCVFHELAAKTPEICQFDLAMMEAFTDSKVDHQQCMVRGDNVCRFRFSGKK